MYKPYEPDLDHKINVCMKCKYSKSFYRDGFRNPNRAGSVYCDYLLMTGQSRPCPADQCTVFEPRPVNEKFKRGPGIII